MTHTLSNHSIALEKGALFKLVEATKYEERQEKSLHV